MEILSATSGIFTDSTSVTQGPHKVFHRAPHNPAVLNEIHLNPQQYAPKTISIVASHPPRARGGWAGGPTARLVLKVAYIIGNLEQLGRELNVIFTELQSSVIVKDFVCDSITMRAQGCPRFAKWSIENE